MSHHHQHHQHHETHEPHPNQGPLGTEPSPPAAPHPPERRQALQWIALTLGGLATAAMGIPVVGYLLGTLIKPEPDEWIGLGPLGNFPERQTRLADFLNPTTQPWEGKTVKSSAYVRRIDAVRFQVFAINCAHLGCPVAWFPQSGLFMCPCHGGVYYEDGSHASGPPPRGLFQYDWRLTDPDHGRQIVSADEAAKLDEAAQKKLVLEIRAGHLPTLQDTLRNPDPGAKA